MRWAYARKLAPATYKEPLESANRVWPIRRFQLFDLRVCQLQMQACDRIIQVSKLRRPDNRRGDSWLRQNPRKRDLCRRNSASLGNLSHRIDNILIAGLVVELSRKVVAFGAPRCCVVG